MNFHRRGNLKSRALGHCFVILFIGEVALKLVDKLFQVWLKSTTITTALRKDKHFKELSQK
jgi:hypothetical protein